MDKPFLDRPDTPNLNKLRHLPDDAEQMRRIAYALALADSEASGDAHGFTEEKIAKNLAGFTATLTLVQLVCLLRGRTNIVALDQLVPDVLEDLILSEIDEIEFLQQMVAKPFSNMVIDQLDKAVVLLFFALPNLSWNQTRPFPDAKHPQGRMSEMNLFVDLVFSPDPERAKIALNYDRVQIKTCARILLTILRTGTF